MRGREACLPGLTRAALLPEDRPPRPRIAITDMLLTRQIPRSDPRKGNLHFQHASQMNLKHMKG